MKKRLRSPAVMLVVFAMVITTAGIVYAHWTTTSAIEGQINTGNIHMGWEMVGTDDDGDLGNDPTGTDDGGGTLFDGMGDGSSDDPSSGWPVGARYDKDVAGCWANPDEEGVINWNVDNGYPSYYCHLFAKAVNHGSVPVKATALRIWAEKGTWFCTSHFTDDFSDPDFGPYWSGDENG